jgi:hypothetical protein
MTTPTKTTLGFRQLPLSGFSVSVGVFFLALLVRFVLMGIGFHGDLYSIYWRAHQVAYHGEALEHNQLLAHAIHIVWLWVLRILGIVSHAIWIHPFDYGSGWRTLATHPNAWILLILLKLPYLVAELAALRVLLGMIDKETKRTIALFWLFNPLLLYGVHLYGRYESFPVLLVILALAAAQKRRFLWGLVALLGATLVRFYAALFLPLYLWLIPKNGQERLRMLIVMIAPLLLVLILQMVMASSPAAFRDSAELVSLLTMPHRTYLFAAYIPLLQADVIYLFPLGICLLYLAVLHVPRPASAVVFWRWSAMVMYWLFATTYFHPQWLVWVVPFLAIQLNARRSVFPLTWIMAFCMAFYTFQFDREVSVLLFAPLAPASFEHWQHPMVYLDSLKVGGVLIGTLRTVLSAILIYLGWHARSDEPLGNTGS